MSETLNDILEREPIFFDPYSSIEAKQNEISIFHYLLVVGCAEAFLARH